MGNQQIYALASQQVPIQRISPLFNSAEYKKQQALMAGAELTQRISGGIKNHYEEMEKFRQNLNIKSQNESLEIFKSRGAEIAAFDFDTNNPEELARIISEAQSLNRYYYSPFIKLPNGANDGLAKINQYKALAEAKLAKLNSGENSSSVTNPISANSYFDIENQKQGERNILG